MKRKGRPLKQFCPKGHDTFIVGRTKSRACRTCHELLTNRWVAKNRERRNRRVVQRRWRYQDQIKNLDGSQFTLVNYDIFLKKQAGRCAICKINKTQEKKPLAADHDHQTGIVRGLLCIKCNNLLGLSRDSTEVLRAAISYLEKSRFACNQMEELPQ